MIGNSEDWVVQKLNSLGGNFRDCSINYVQGLDFCWDGVSLQGMVVLSEAQFDPFDLGRDGSSLLAHEYFHLVQQQLAKPDRYLIKDGSFITDYLFPAWLVEGSAEFAGYSVAALAMGSEYWQGRERMFNSVNRNALEDAEIRTFLGTQPNGPIDPYGIGRGATEFLVASIGFQKLLDIFGSFRETKNFEKSFEAVTGVSKKYFYDKFELVRTKLSMYEVSMKLVCLTNVPLRDAPQTLPKCDINSTQPSTALTPVFIPKSFAELVGNTDGAAIAAWESTDKKIKSSSAVAVRHDIYVGPSTSVPNANVKDVFENATRLFAGFNQPKSFFSIYYRYQDKNWAKAKLLELNQPNRVQEIDGSCSSINRCNGASAGKASINVGFSQFAVTEPGPQSSKYHLDGGVEIHEYAHIAQAMQFVGKLKDDRNFEYLPRWLIEGHAHLAGIAGAAKTLEEYQQNRREWLNTTPNQEIKSFSPENIERFYSSLMPGKYNADMFGYVYTIGFFTIENLVALKGIDSPMELILQVSNGSTFEQAFNNVYGMTWDKASPILAETVARMFMERK